MVIRYIRNKIPTIEELNMPPILKKLVMEPRGLILARAEYGEKLGKQIFPGIQGGPLMHVIAAKAIAFQEALSDDFRDYQGQVLKNARRQGSRGRISKQDIDSAAAVFIAERYLALR